MSKEEQSNHVKMYWQECPHVEDENAIRNVLPDGVYCEPGKIMNSTHVHAEAKPWLQKTKAKKKEIKLQNPPAPALKKPIVAKKSTTSQKEVKKVPETKSNKAMENMIVEKSSKPECTLAELCKEDKQRVADLVREMAKFSEEKEKAVYELTNLKTNFSSKMKALEIEKQKMIKEQDNLKEKVLRYELILKEIKDKQVNNDKKSVESILKNHISLQETSIEYDKQPFQAEATPEKFPGNLKQCKSVENPLKRKDEETCDDVQKAAEFTDLFFKQQDKFHQQQEILQKQIEQLQKLQESILEQQQQQLKESRNDTKVSSEGQQINSAIQPEIDDNEDDLLDGSHKGKYSIKLQNYISKQPKYESCLDGLKRKPANAPVQVLVSDTLMEEDSRNNTLISVHCLNASNKSSKVDSAVQTIANMAVQTVTPAVKPKNKPTSKKEDAGFQTEEPLKKQIIETEEHQHDKDSTNLKKLETCKKHIEQLEESIKDLSSQKLVPTANLHKGSSRGKCKIYKENKLISEKIAMNEISLPDGEDDDVVNKNTSVNSALQRGHFQPDSILDLIDGLEPPSASTSISTSYRKISPPRQQNRKVSRKTPLSPVKQMCSKSLSPNNHHTKAKARSERNNKIHKVYSTLKAKRHEKNSSKQKSIEDQEEQKMLADVFFVR